MIIKRDSWHYKLIGTFMYHKRDFCGYVRQALFLVFLMGLVAVCLLFWFGALGIAIFAKLGISSAGFMILPATLTGLMAIGLTLGLSGGLVFGVFYLHDKFKERCEEKEYEARKNGTYVKPGFIKLAYKSFKDKHCKLIEFK